MAPYQGGGVGMTDDGRGKKEEVRGKMYDGRVKNLKILITMKKVAFILICLLFCCTMVSAQEKSELQKQAEAIAPGQNNAQARSLYIRAFNEYVNKGQTRQGVECGVKGVALYYKENAYK